MRTAHDMRTHVKSARYTDRDTSIGFVPTMGALHEGHLDLIRAAASENEEVVVSIFVNPTQFGVSEDLSSYPRTFDSDMSKIRALNEHDLPALKAKGRVTAVFAPTARDMYPTLPPTSEEHGEGSFVLITPVGRLLEGAQRPVFFRGVATVCAKLFNIVAADRVYFGQKDAQQAVVIRRLVRDFHVDTHVRVMPTTREPDGLAMSSRNVYLGARRRQAARMLPRLLGEAAARYQDGETRREVILRPFAGLVDGSVHSSVVEPYGQVRYQLGYVSVADPDTMEEVREVDKSKGAILSAALLMLPVEKPGQGEDLGEAGGVERTVRLIDNIVLEPWA